MCGSEPDTVTPEIPMAARSAQRATSNADSVVVAHAPRFNVVRISGNLTLGIVVPHADATGISLWWGESGHALPVRTRKAADPMGTRARLTQCDVADQSDLRLRMKRR